MKDFLTIEELAQRWHVCVMTIRRKVYAKQLPVSRVGRKLLFPLKEIEKYELSRSENVSKTYEII